MVALAKKPHYRWMVYDATRGDEPASDDGWLGGVTQCLPFNPTLEFLDRWAQRLALQDACWVGVVCAAAQRTRLTVSTNSPCLPKLGSGNIKTKMLNQQLPQACPAPSPPAATCPSLTSTAAACACGRPTAEPSASARAASRLVSRAQRCWEGAAWPVQTQSMSNSRRGGDGCQRFRWSFCTPSSALQAQACPAACRHLPWMQWVRCRRSRLFTCSPCRTSPLLPPTAHAAARTQAPSCSWLRRRRLCGWHRARLPPGAGNRASDCVG